MSTGKGRMAFRGRKQVERRRFCTVGAEVRVRLSAVSAVAAGAEAEARPLACFGPWPGRASPSRGSGALCAGPDRGLVPTRQGPCPGKPTVLWRESAGLTIDSRGQLRAESGSRTRRRSVRAGWAGRLPGVRSAGQLTVERGEEPVGEGGCPWSREEEW